MYEKFAQLLKDNNVSAYKVSKETGIATSTLSDWKNGRSTPKVDKLQKIAEYFNVSTDYFVGDKPSSEESEQVNPLTGKKMTKRELSQYEKVMNEATLMFNNEDISEEDKEKLMMALNDMFWKAKRKNKEKYAKTHKMNI